MSNEKKELGRVSKQLIELEHECLELKKERNKEDKPVDSRNEAQVAQFQSLKTVRFCKAAAVQADLHTCLDLSKKLQGIWAPPSDNFGRSMMSKLFVDCPSDFNALFGFMSVDSSCKMVSRLAVEGSSDASKVSTLYSAVTKISNGMMPLETLFEPLFDLCRVENNVIAHRSLHILHVLLKHLLTFERKSEGRTLLMREVLILLNRLVSNSLYSATFLRALTLNRDMASLTIDLATRLSKREHNPGWSDSMFKQMRESEIVDLGRVFKKRVFAYLGDNVH
ncbi:hypothetical protein SLEP1_g9146 [Rubroshorea leprosula]|uniref:Uncharacterized protein n=1 Tax=Rubroshorea leprosula TaxID=152421 RepID=A0AAV5ID93_9ROSI|nr:hypothetical protein SLEP1_g9146 [Rubroshorea leprosula]